VHSVATSLQLETERLLLRPFVEDDFDALYAMQSRTDVARWLLWEPRTPAEVREALEEKLTSRALDSDHDVLALAVELKATGELIGDLVLQLLDLTQRTAEIGFIVHPHHHGMGYATEAGRALLGYAFGDRRLHRVIGRVEPRNTASARVLEKLGMRLEAHLVENELVKGEWQSELGYAILEREWAGSAGSGA